MALDGEARTRREACVRREAYRQGCVPASLSFSLLVADDTLAGSIEYSAEFFPAAHLKGISFNEPVSDAITEVDEEDSFVEAASASQISLNESVSSVKPKEVKKDDPNEGIVIPREELIRTRE